MMKEDEWLILLQLVIDNAKDKKGKWRETPCVTKLIFSKVRQLKVLGKIESSNIITMIKVQVVFPVLFSCSDFLILAHSLNSFFLYVIIRIKCFLLILNIIIFRMVTGK